MTYKLKTTINDSNVKEFINSVENEQRKQDSLRLLELFSTATNKEPKMWGTNIIGFGSYHYKYASGQEGDWMATGFSPRKQSLSLYIMSGFDTHKELLDQLGKHKVGKSCLYINKLSDVNIDVLDTLIKASFQHVIKTQSGC